MKSSTISNPFALADNADAAALVERIMPAPTYRGTYNSIVNACLLAFTLPAFVVVNTRARTVSVAVASAALSGATNITGARFHAPGTVVREVSPVNPDERSAGIVVKEVNSGTLIAGDIVTSGVVAPEGQSEFDAALDSALGAQDTAKSLGSLADAIADAMAAEGKDGIIIFDQLAPRCWFYANNIADARDNDVKAVIDAVTADATLAVFNVAEPEVTAPVGFFGV